jgi:hypothetical protein
MINDPNIKLSLLKWPDVVQSALGYIATHKKGINLGIDQEQAIARKILKDDLTAAMLMPIKALYEATQERVKAVVDKEPLTEVVLDDDPIILKNNYLVAINDMFKVLETMTAIKYPTIKEKKEWKQ